MATLPGLFQRGGVWWLRVMVPIDLRPAVGGRDKVVRSLNTPDRRQASRLALTRRAALLSAFEQGSLDSVRESKASPPLLPASIAVPPAAQPPAPTGNVPGENSFMFGSFFCAASESASASNPSPAFSGSVDVMVWSGSNLSCNSPTSTTVVPELVADELAAVVF
jgi:hypothetical protein